MNEVVNAKDYGSKQALNEAFQGRWIYVGRKNISYGFRESILANTPRKEKQTRKGSIELYRQWLWGKIRGKDMPVMGAMALIKEDSVLVCWCKPKDCHADIIWNAWNWLRKRREEREAVNKPIYGELVDIPVLGVVQDITDEMDEYRFHDDAENMVRINSETPSDANLLYSSASVVGITYREEKATEFILGYDRSLTLEREPGNKYDKNAIQVIGHWLDRELQEQHQAHIGYVSGKLVGHMTEGEYKAQLLLMFQPTSQKHLGVRMNIWKVESALEKGSTPA